MTLKRIFTTQSEDGRSLPYVQPDAIPSGAPLVDVTSLAAQSLSIPDGVHMVIVAVTEDMHIAFNATATSSRIPLRGGTLYGDWCYFPVTPGDTISFIAASTTGTVYVATVKEVS